MMNNNDYRLMNELLKPDVKINYVSICKDCDVDYTRYLNWLRMAILEAAEAKKYKTILEGARKYEDTACIQNFVNSKLALMKVYKERSDVYKRKYVKWLQAYKKNEEVAGKTA